MTMVDPYPSPAHSSRGMSSICSQRGLCQIPLLWPQPGAPDLLLCGCPPASTAEAAEAMNPCLPPQPELTTGPPCPVGQDWLVKRKEEVSPSEESSKP